MKFFNNSSLPTISVFCGTNVTVVLGVMGSNESLKHLFLFLLASSLDSLAANVKVIVEVAFVK